ncbi:MAG: DUF1361 domain-containing protein [Bacteroidota bacterium]
MNALWQRLRSISFDSQFITFLVGSILSMGLLIFRMYLTDSLMFFFLAWNLFLAWIPWLVAIWLTNKKRQTWILIAGSAIWLLFFPNSPYIITDLFHLRPRNGVPQWYDLTLIMSFAWTGLLFGLGSLYRMQMHVFNQFGKAWSITITGFIILLTSYGIYLGRFLRWNSWDLFTRPQELLLDVVDPLLAPRQNLGTTAFTILFGLFLVLTYLSFIQRQQQRISS